MVQLTKKHTLEEKRKLTVNQAIKIISEKFNIIAKKEYKRIDSINNRYLAKDIISKINLPPTNNTAVDGIAFKYSDLSKSSQNFLTKAPKRVLFFYPLVDLIFNEIFYNAKTIYNARKKIFL